VKIARIRTDDGRIANAVVDDKYYRLIEGDIFGTWRPVGKSLALEDVKLFAPLIPLNFLCIGRNYKAHAEEGGDSLPKAPLLFIKATSCILDPGDAIVIPASAPEQVDYEAELAVVIGKKARNVSEKDALIHVFGYTCVNDVSARDVQNGDGQWARGKSIDTFGPMGPWIETELDVSNLKIQGRLNGKALQDASTSLLIFKVPYLISYLSRFMTLMPGTVISTGTPAGCGFAQKPPTYFKDGDVFEVEIEGIGVLRNPIRKE
jgi:2-keto-4-pentenoate hydratase/2-oxohepta-3-ene-1,7-dioic acid hydratase in catechol pathway